MHYRTKRQHVSALQVTRPLTEQFESMFGDRVLDRGVNCVLLRDNQGRSILAMEGDWVMIAPQGIEIITREGFDKYYEAEDPMIGIASKRLIELTPRGISDEEFASRVVSLLIMDQGNLNEYRRTIEFCLQVYKRLQSEKPNVVETADT